MPWISGSVTPVKTSCQQYYPWGLPWKSSDTTGQSTTITANATTNYAAPGTVTTQIYSQNVSYNSWLGATQATGANGEQLTITYDSMARSPYTTSGTTWTYTYSAPGVSPITQTKTGPDGVTTSTLDGLGRVIRVARGDTSGVQSYTDTVYAPCACSPLGKISKVSQPYAPGAGTIYWTVYTYDGIGRTLAVTQPDGASATTYSYSGNQTLTTDPAGKWKQYTNDVLGNLTSVVEPDPANQPGGTLTTTYTYDWMNHVSGVSMTRGSTTQTRTFVYSDAGLLTSATNPENGTVTYTYNADNTLQDKHDAKGQDTVYTYDTAKRPTMIQRYPNGRSYAEDLCERVTYSYDTNPLNPSFSLNSTGRLTVAQYGSNTLSTYCVPGVNPTQLAEMYSYHPAGAVTAKRLQITRQGYDQYSSWVTGVGTLDADYSYDQAGHVLTYARPGDTFGATGPVTYTYSFDTMGRPASLADNDSTYGPGGHSTTWTQSVLYDLGGRRTSMSYLSSAAPPYYNTESWSYNVNGQLATLNWAGGSLGINGSLQYSYSATQNNGQISQVVDSVSGETIVYQYDLLRRLTSASSTPNYGSSPTPWTQTFQYDGFGNLTAKVLNGTTTPIAVNAATNQLTSGYYDANGNMTSGLGATMAYDEANRLSSAAETSGGTEYYGYAPDNKRVYRLLASGSEEWTMYGAYGEKLAVYSMVGPTTGSSSTYSFTPLRTSVWFAGKLIWEGNAAVFGDPLGTNRASGARFYPYGDEITSTSNDRTKFATYNRDSFTGFDYADQRFYANVYGRFGTPDPYGGSAQSSSPLSWNRYSYTGGDPINRSDPRGLDPCDPSADASCGVPCDPNNPDCWYCANPNDPDAPGPCGPPPDPPSDPPACAAAQNGGSCTPDGADIYEMSEPLASVTGTSTAWCPGISQWSETLKNCDVPVAANMPFINAMEQNLGLFDIGLQFAVRIGAPGTPIQAGVSGTLSGSTGTFKVGPSSIVRMPLPVPGQTKPATIGTSIPSNDFRLGIPTGVAQTSVVVQNCGRVSVTANIGSPAQGYLSVSLGYFFNISCPGN